MARPGLSHTVLQYWNPTVILITTASYLHWQQSMRWFSWQQQGVIYRGSNWLSIVSETVTMNVCVTVLVSFHSLPVLFNTLQSQQCFVCLAAHSSELLQVIFDLCWRLYHILRWQLPLHLDSQQTELEMREQSRRSIWREQSFNTLAYVMSRALTHILTFGRSPRLICLMRKTSNYLLQEVNCQSVLLLMKNVLMIYR